MKFILCSQIIRAIVIMTLKAKVGGRIFKINLLVVCLFIMLCSN